MSSAASDVPEGLLPATRSGFIYERDGRCFWTCAWCKTEHDISVCGTQLRIGPALVGIVCNQTCAEAVSKAFVERVLHEGAL